MLMQPRTVVAQVIPYMHHRPAGVLYRVCFSALGRRTYVRDQLLHVTNESARFYGTLHKGITENSSGDHLMTVEEV